MDEFFQFEPFKVFSKVQTDSLIFKIHALGADPPDRERSFIEQVRKERARKEHRTVFLRHEDHHKALSGILEDYANFSVAEHSEPGNNNPSIMVSLKSRQELSVVIDTPTPTTPSDAGTGFGATTAGSTATNPWTYSFAPMMPSSGVTTYLLKLTQELRGICSAVIRNRKESQPSATEPLLWHRGPNTNPVYGLVVRMQYARDKFGENMSQQWFHPAFYWNGKNSPEETTQAAAGGASNKAQNKEWEFWKSRDPLRLHKKEGSPAQSYSILTPDYRRLYALCMVDKHSSEVLKQQADQKVEGSNALRSYLEDVRNHFQPGLVSKGKGGDIAYFSTKQCG